ncbi:MAG: carbohydrate kinase [Gammaproteobacteria bacterium]|nr:carbohydrate kinase [Gammaproteobacteria bacterium]
MTHNQVLIFGEVLFDCFPDGTRVLGGAPFNVAWHLQALGDKPVFISQVGQDPLGDEIRQAMTNWGMTDIGLNIDQNHPTGTVQVDFVGDEPQYTITPDCAYDFIASEQVTQFQGPGMLYHGSLGLRNPSAQTALSQLLKDRRFSVFIDVNLRPPWWQLEQIQALLRQAQWVKLNEQELRDLGHKTDDLTNALQDFQAIYSVEDVILTRGSEGALLRTPQGEIHSIDPKPISQVVDTVGAGDAFSAMFIHGLLANWSIPKTLDTAQQFATKVIGLRGAVSTDPEFYLDFHK